MYTEEETQYLTLNAKFRAELEDIDKQIDALMARRAVLTAILNGEASIEETEPESENEKRDDPSEDDRILRELVKYLKKRPGQKRADLEANWIGHIDSQDLTRLLKKGKRQGLLIVEGRARASQWYATVDS